MTYSGHHLEIVLLCATNDTLLALLHWLTYALSAIWSRTLLIFRRGLRSLESASVTVSEARFGFCFLFSKVFFLGLYPLELDELAGSSSTAETLIICDT